MSDITVINDSEQSSLVTNGLAKNGELYLKASGSTDAGAVVVYDSGSWRTFANELSAFSNAYSVEFDGSNDYATATLGSQVFDGDFSISFWFNADTASNLYSVLIQSGSSGSYNDGFRIYRYSSGALAFWKGQGGYSNIFGDIGTTATGSWYHIAVTRSGSTFTFYLNGSSIDTGTDSQSYTSTAFQMSFTTYPFNGLMDEVALWDSALSSANVNSIYNSGVPADISSLSPVHWWRMGDNDGGSGTTITDQGSGSNNGTLTNGPTFSSIVPS